MAKKVAEFLKTLLVKAGANLESDTVKAMVTAISGLDQNIEIPDELAATIDNGLLNLQAAKNNYPEIKNHYFAQAYAGLDNELNSFLESEALEDPIKQEILAEKSSTKRAVLIAKKIKELEGKKKSSGDSTEKAQYTQQITDLNNQLRLVKEERQGLEAKHANELKNMKKDFQLNSTLDGYKTIHDTMDPATKRDFITAVLNRHLAAKNATFSVNDNGDLILVGKDGANVFGPDNREFTAKSFIDTVFANEKILAVNADNGNGNQNNGSNGQHSNKNGQQRQQSQNNNQNNNQNQNNNGNGNVTGANAGIKSLTQKAREAFEKGSVAAQ